ncbi:MAG: hypothetical protein ACRDRL_16280 [Sciscionella sp.]
MSEFIGVDHNALPHQVDERAGDLAVWYHGLILARFPWHSHVEIDERGILRILDLESGRWVKEYAPGAWTAVNHVPREHRT